MPQMQRQQRVPDQRPGMVWIPGGAFRMGSDVHYPEEAPVRRVEVEGFWIDARPVSNRDFAAFVEATGWVTTAEKPAKNPLVGIQSAWRTHVEDHAP